MHKRTYHFLFSVQAITLYLPKWMDTFESTTLESRPIGMVSARCCPIRPALRQMQSPAPKIVPCATNVNNILNKDQSETYIEGEISMLIVDIHRVVYAVNIWIKLASQGVPLRGERRRVTKFGE